MRYLLRSVKELHMTLDSLATHIWAIMPDALEAYSAQYAQATSNASEEAMKLSAENTKLVKRYAIEEGVALIPVMGMLTSYSYSGWGYYGARTGMLDEVRPAIEAALADSAVDAILLDVASPGGTVTGMKELADYIASCREQKTKPMAAYANGLMASAAYMIGSATGCVFAPATATVGSIGVISVYQDFSKYNEKIGFSYSYITAGKWKAVGNPHSPMTDEERSYLQKRLATLYGHFTDSVSRNMGLDASQCAVWADGQIFVASEAPQGLVTAIVADREEAIHRLSKEIAMDKATLARNHSTLLAEIEQAAMEQGKQRAQEETRQQTEGALQKQRESILAAVKAVIGEEALAKIESLLELDLSASQLEAVTKLFPQVAVEGAKQEAGAAAPNTSTSSRILAELMTGHSKPVAAAPVAPQDETPMQFGKRIAAMLHG